MDLSYLRRLYELDGPVLTAYVELQSSVEDGAARRDIAWKGLLRDGTDLGMDVQTLSAVETARDAGDLAGDTRLIVAAAGAVQLDRSLPAPPISPFARVGPLPALLPLIAHDSNRRAHLVVLADHVGADILLFTRADDHAASEVTTPDAEWPVHKTGAGGWAAKRYDATVEESWERSARRAAEQVAKLAHEHGTKIVIGSGEPKAISMIAEELPADLCADFTVVPGGGRHRDGGDEELARRISEAVAERIAHDDLAILDRFAAARGRGQGAAEGAGTVISALRQGQVETLLISTAAYEGDHVAWFGREPNELALQHSELAEMGVATAEQALLADVVLRAAAGTGAAVVVISPDADAAPGGGIGALLRYEQ